MPCAAFGRTMCLELRNTLKSAKTAASLIQSLVGEGPCALPLPGMVKPYDLAGMQFLTRPVIYIDFPCEDSGGHRGPPLPREQRLYHAGAWG